MAVSPGPVVDHVLQSHQGHAALLIAAAGFPLLASSGQVGAQVNALA